MKKVVLFLFLLLVSATGGYGKDHGIKFFKGSYAEAIGKAKSEGKLLFMDFYTEWCGPCLLMAENVFTLPEVGAVYNSGFVSYKVDAEKGEGIELAKRFNVYSYPAYIFIDPETGEMIHRSGSNKPVEDFLEDARGALDPKRNSVYLETRHGSGNYDDDLLIDYILYKYTSGNRKAAAELFDELISRGATLKDEKVWAVFCRCVDDYRNPQVRELSDDYPAYVGLYGRKAVDDKLYKVTGNAPAQFIAGLADFDGKRQSIELGKFIGLCRAKKYDEAAGLVDTIIADPGFDMQRTIDAIQWYALVSPRRTDDSVPFEWVLKQVGLLRFIAYNTEPRNDVQAHFDYAAGLEYLINRAAAEGRDIPPFGTPEVRSKEYDTISGVLKPKPAGRR